MSDYYPNSKLAVKLDPIVEPKRREIQDRQPYKFPKGYINYQTFLELILVSEIRKKVFNYRDDLDVTTAIFCEMSSCWEKENIPIYGLSQETLTLFQNSKIDRKKDLFENLPQSQTTKYCVLLPSGGFKTIGDHYLEVIWIESIRNSEAEPKQFFGESVNSRFINQVKANSQRIKVSGIDTSERSYCVFSDYPSSQENIDNINDDEAWEESAYQIIYNLRNLALQIVMAIEFLPEAIRLNARPLEAINKGFAVKNKPIETATYWQIRQIDLQLKRYIVKSNNNNNSEENHRKSPRAHWRKWHWRRVAVGTDRQGREWRLIPNTFVNPENN